MRDSDGNYIATQLVEVDNITSHLRRLYVEAYLGVSPKETPKYWLIFQVSIPPIGWSTYFISKDSQKGSFRNSLTAYLCLTFYFKFYSKLLNIFTFEVWSYAH